MIAPPSSPPPRPWVPCRKRFTLQILITIIVIIAMVMHLRAIHAHLGPCCPRRCSWCSSRCGMPAWTPILWHSPALPLPSGTMVDMGIILTENILRHFRGSGSGESAREVVFRATREVSGAILTAGSTTIISFLPVFFMEAAEGKLFRPLAFTKTFALVCGHPGNPAAAAPRWLTGCLHESSRWTGRGGPGTGFCW